MRRILVAVALLAAGAAPAADVQVMISAGFFGAYSELAPAFERATGHRLVTTRGPSMGDSPEAIPTRLARGEYADVVIMDGGAADALDKRGLLRAGSKVELARSQVGMVVRAGAPKPDISSVEAFRKALLAAKSIAYSDSGSGTYLSGTLFAKLGVAEQVAGKSRKVRGPPSGEPVAAVVARGEAEIGFQQVAELIHVAGVTYVGPIPAELQPGFSFAGGVTRDARQPEAAGALLRFLASSEAAATIVKAGLAPAQGDTMNVVSIEAKPAVPYGSFGGRDYVRIEGRFTGELKPTEAIPGLDKAPRNARGKVEYRANFALIAPIGVGNGTLLLDVPNRGRPISHFMYNSPRGKPLPLGLEQGTGFLQGAGYAVASVQWELGQGIEIPSYTDADGKQRFVEGVGPAALRDFAEFLRYGESGQGNPLAGRVERVIAIGYSQTARLLKTLLLQGFDQSGSAPVFDALHLHASASGLADVFTTGTGPASSTFFTPRFTAPEHRGVTEEPLAYRDIVARVATKGRQPPLMIVTNVTTDYYSIRASLARTGARGTTDLAIPPSVRIYDIAGGSHSLTLEKRCELPPGQLDFTPALRAALVNLDRWLRGTEPPASRLMLLEPLPDEASLLQAPKHLPGAIVQAPKRDADGNSMGGVRLPDMEAPLGTHGLQNRPLADRACNLDGAFLAFPREKIAQRYPSKADYVEKIRAAANRAVADRFLLVHDAAEIVRSAQAAEVP